MSYDSINEKSFYYLYKSHLNGSYCTEEDSYDFRKEKDFQIIPELDFPNNFIENKQKFNNYDIFKIIKIQNINQEREKENNINFNKYNNIYKESKYLKKQKEKEKEKEEEIVYLNKKKGKPGKKPKNENNSKKKHTCLIYDNLQLKIQVHFHSFLINLANDALITEFGQNHQYGNFKNINYSEKKNITLNNFFNQQSNPIKNIIEKEISDKYKTVDKNNNKKIVEDTCKKSEWLKFFYNINYLEIFKYYFNWGKPLNIIKIQDKEIKLSKKTKTFYDLMTKFENIKSFLFNAVKRGYERLFIKFEISNKIN